MIGRSNLYKKAYLKRLFLAILVVISIVLLFVFVYRLIISNQNGDIPETDTSYFEYYLLDNGYAIIERYNGDNTEVCVPNTIEGHSVIGVDEAFYMNENIERVKLSEGIIRIGMDTFNGCTNLKEVTLPESTCFLLNRAFANSGLKEIVLPKNIFIIGDECFAGCNDLYYVDLQIEDIKIVGNNIFKDTSLRGIKVPYVGKSDNNNTYVIYPINMFISDYDDYIYVSDIGITKQVSLSIVYYWSKFIETVLGTNPLSAILFWLGASIILLLLGIVTILIIILFNNFLHGRNVFAYYIYRNKVQKNDNVRCEESVIVIHWSRSKYIQIKDTIKKLLLIVITIIIFIAIQLWLQVKISNLFMIGNFNNPICYVLGMITTLLIFVIVYRIFISVKKIIEKKYGKFVFSKGRVSK